MKKRTLGQSDLQITTVGLGAWAIGGKWSWGWGAQDDAESIDTIHAALDAGINWIDTAPVYGLGHSEIVVGEALVGHRQDAYIFTKCGLVWTEGKDDPRGSLKSASIRREVEASLRRLQTDVIDLYQVHWPNPDEDLEEAWSTIADLVGEGKIRYAGASNFNIDQLKRVQAIHPVMSLQPPYSMLARGLEDELMGFCEEQNIGIIVYSPMQAGLLTGKFSRERVDGLDESDWRRGSENFQEPELTVNLALVEGLRPIAQRNNRSLAQLSIAWVLRRPAITGAIVGARRPQQIQETAPAGDWTLSDDDIEEIAALLSAREQSISG